MSSPAERAAAAARRDALKKAAGVDRPGPIRDKEVGVTHFDTAPETLKTAGATTVTDRTRPLQARPTAVADVDAYEDELAQRRAATAPQQSLPIVPQGVGLPETRQGPESVKDALAEQLAESQATAQATGYTDARRVSHSGGDPAVPLVTHQGPQGARSGLPRSGRAA